MNPSPEVAFDLEEQEFEDIPLEAENCIEVEDINLLGETPPAEPANLEATIEVLATDDSEIELELDGTEIDALLAGEPTIPNKR